MWILRIGNLYHKSHNAWFPLYEILLERKDGARWLDDVELDYWHPVDAKVMSMAGHRYLVECLKLQNSSRKMALIMEMPDGYELGQDAF